MSIFLILVFTLAIIIISRIIFRSWFNHVSFYSAIWCVNLSLYEIRLIKYFPMEYETWMVIMGTWILFVLGAITALQVNRYRSAELSGSDHAEIPEQGEVRFVKKILWSLNSATLAAAVYNLYLASKLYGGIGNAFIMGNLIYSYRVSEGIPGTIPYVASFVFVASVLAGLYTAWVQRITFVAVMPVVVIIIIDFTLMGRADILVGAILFVSSYFAGVIGKEELRERKKMNVRKYVSFVLLIALVVGGAELIRSTRKVKENIRGSTASLNKFSAASIITPSIYLYFSSSIGVFNQYLKHDREHTPIGGHTFLTLFRIGERAGLDIHASVYQQWYRTPAYTNTGTYLRELHGDFGMLGLFVGPYLMGFFTSYFWLKYKRHKRYRDLFLLAYMYGIIGMSFIVIATRMGGYFFFPFIALAFGYYLDRRQKDRLVRQQ